MVKENAILAILSFEDIEYNFLNLLTGKKVGFILVYTFNLGST